MDVPMAVVGVLLVGWPFYARGQFGQIHARIRARGGDAGRFAAFMDHRLLRVAYWVTTVLGLALLILAIVEP